MTRNLPLFPATGPPRQTGQYIKIFRNQLNLFLLAGLTQAASIDQPQLAQITGRMNAFVASGSIAGAVTLVEHQGKIVHLAATGYNDLAGKTKMDTGTILEIMSMTKPFTGTAIMMLAEEGRQRTRFGELN